MMNIHFLFAFGTTLASLGFGVFIFPEATRAILRKLKQSWVNMRPGDKELVKTGIFVVLGLTFLVLHGLTDLLDWMDW